jgi:ABC-type lipoprotein export system ATPase subunit
MRGSWRRIAMTLFCRARSLAGHKEASKVQSILGGDSSSLGEPLVLKRVVIENYRSCLRTSIDLHPNLSVLIGPNGSGKTNILQAIMFLNKMVREEPFISSRKRASAVSSRLKATFHEDGADIRLNASLSSYTNESNNDVMLASQQKWRLSRQRGKPFSTDLPISFAAQLRPDQTSHQIRYFNVRAFRGVDTGIPKWAKQGLGSVAAYCDGIRYYGASQFTNPGNSPTSFQIDREGRHRRPSGFAGHKRILYSMYSAQKADPNHRYQQFVDIVGPKGLRLIDDLTFQEVETSSTDYSVRVGGRVEIRKRNRLLVIPQFRIGKQKLSPNQLSEGTFKTLALLFHVITEDGTALLVEEPEVCVHQGLLSSILELIKSSARQKQMILSTHSDYVLDHVSPENVYRITFDKSAGTVAKHITKAMTSKEYKALREYLDEVGNLGEYWREGGLEDRQ